VTLADLGVAVDPASVPQSIMTAVEARPSRGAGIRIEDDGSAGEQLAAFLIENRLIEG
jgi:electron transfer flavoprotein beta subunit